MRYDSVATEQLVKVLDNLAMTAEGDEVLVDRQLLVEIADRLDACQPMGDPEGDERQLDLL